MHGLQTKDHLRNSIEHSGGFTWSPFQATPVSGYMVGITPIVTKPNNTNPLTNDELKLALEWIQSNPANLFLGGWKDTETNEVYYDISAWYPDFDSALYEAEMQGEKAIFNLSTMQEIKL